MTSNHRALDDSDIALIERVKLTPSLYDPRNSDFRLAYRKGNDWESVASGVGMSAIDARRRWTCLRDRYTRELKQLRMHPDKGDFGKNDFFLLMDFLRRFVRKRRVRRNTLIKYDSFEGYSSMDSNKIIERMASSEVDEDENEEAEDIVEEQHSAYGDHARVFLSNKMDIAPNAEGSDEYPEYVEVDTSETYEEYIEPQTTDVASSDNTKRTVIPIMLQPANGTTYTLTTARQQNVATSIQHQQQLQQQQHMEQKQHQQTQLPAETTTNNNDSDTADDFFSKAIAAYLRQLSIRHKIKAKIEMFQILEKYIELEDNHNESGAGQKC